jgi:hypothetical protein
MSTTTAKLSKAQRAILAELVSLDGRPTWPWTDWPTPLTRRDAAESRAPAPG